MATRRHRQRPREGLQFRRSCVVSHTKPGRAIKHIFFKHEFLFEVIFKRGYNRSSNSRMLVLCGPCPIAPILPAVCFCAIARQIVLSSQDLLSINLLLPKPLLTRLAFSCLPFIPLVVWSVGTIKAYRKYASLKVAGWLSAIGFLLFLAFPLLMYLAIIVGSGGWSVGK